MEEHYLIIIEYAKGSDKGVDGFRADTKVIQKAIQHHAQCEGEIVFYTHKKRELLKEYMLKRSEGKSLIVVSRINPGNLKRVDEYFYFLKQLSDAGAEV